MDTLLWCFLSLQGRIGRQAFLLSLVLLAIANHLLDIAAPMHGTAAILLPALILLWPNLALAIKRGRDIGIPVPHMALIELGIIAGLIVAPVVGLVAELLSLLVLLAAPADLAERLFVSRR